MAAATGALETRAAALEQQLGAAREALSAAEQRVSRGPVHSMFLDRRLPC